MTAHSVLILGTDAVLAAAPATPVQLIHSCRAAGYDVVVPSSWGDELVASRVIDRLGTTDAPLVQCSCPHVTDRLAEAGGALAPLLLHIVPPPVAAAEYVRALFAPRRPRVTFAGGCPGAAHPSIDVRLSVEMLLASLEERGIHPRSQPTEFDSVLPLDRRRYYSEPGGIPSRQALRQLANGLDLVELRNDDVAVDLAQQLLQKGRALIDISLSLGCTCSGKIAGVGADAARPTVRAMEPPRASSPVMDHSVRLSLDAPPLKDPVVLRVVTSAPLRARPVQSVTPAPEEAMVAIELVGRRRSPPGLPRPVLGGMPLTRTDAGRALPRAYVARRRSSPTGGVRRVESPSSAPVEDSPHAQSDEWKRWVIVATAGLVMGLVLAWLVRVLQ